MSQHFLRYVRQEDWFPFLKCSGCRADERNSGTDLNRWRVRFSIEVKEMQSLSIAAKDVEVGAMKATTAGQNVAQAMQDSFYGRLLDHRAGDIEQGSIPTIGRRQSFVVIRHAHHTSTTRPDLPYRDLSRRRSLKPPSDTLGCSAQIAQTAQTRCPSAGNLLLA